jgi:hypothetical protein
MKKTSPFNLLIIFCLLLSGAIAQNTPDNFWLPIDENNIRVNVQRQIVPQKYLTYRLNSDLLKNKLFSAPLEKTTLINNSTCILSLPLPDGTIQQFRVIESPVMADELSAAYPQIKTFSVKGIDDVYANGKLDWNEFGFHGMIRTIHGDFFIDPYSVGDQSNYITYYTRDFQKSSSDIHPEIGVLENTEKKSESADGQQGNYKTNNSSPAICVGDQLRTYRLAVTCTGEYAVAATGSITPTIPQTLSRIVTSVNRVDGVYETEVAVRMVLVPTQTMVIFTNPSTDPYTQNNNGGALLDESQTVITNIIGTANFDIGHIFSTGGGGIANPASVCSAQNKAKGVTGSNAPVGDPFDIDYVAHEMGHQFSGNHTFNSTEGSCGGPNRNASTAVEPGSGVTVMGYAGICGSNNLASRSIAHFHATSYDEIVNFTNSGSGSSCPVTTTTGNQPPVVTGSGDFIIPKSTAFVLTGSAVDPDGDPLTYSWEEMDLGPGGVGNWNSGTAPYFRSYTPTTTPIRYLPSSAVVLSGNYTGTKGEYVPPTPQVLLFRLTARDNKMGGGGVCYATNNITIDNSGPFTVTNPSAAGITWPSGTQQTVTWDVNNTDNGPIGCVTVRILISTNGGATYSVLDNATPNDGVELVTCPTVSTTIATCRIKVESIGNIFYDVGSNFTISTNTVVSGVGIRPVSENNQLGLSVWPNPANNQLNFSVGNLNDERVTKLSVLDILGKPVLQNQYANRMELKESVDISNLSKGLYFVSVTNDNRTAVYRILKD